MSVHIHEHPTSILAGHKKTLIDTNVGHIRLNQLVETSDEPHGDRSQAGWTSACSWQQRSGEGWVEANLTKSGSIWICT